MIFAIITPLAATIQRGSATDSTAIVPQTKAFIAMIFLFGLFFCFCITPLQILYILECLCFEVRANGLAICFFVVVPFYFYNGFVTTIALVNIGWGYYLVFIFWNIFVAAVVYFLFVETSNRTLEEPIEIFRAKHPVKASLSKSKFVIEGEEIITYGESMDDHEHQEQEEHQERKDHYG